MPSTTTSKRLPRPVRLTNDRWQHLDRVAADQALVPQPAHRADPATHARHRPAPPPTHPPPEADLMGARNDDRCRWLRSTVEDDRSSALVAELVVHAVGVDLEHLARGGDR